MSIYDNNREAAEKRIVFLKADIARLTTLELSAKVDVGRLFDLMKRRSTVNNVCKAEKLKRKYDVAYGRLQLIQSYKQQKEFDLARIEEIINGRAGEDSERIGS